ncbi:MAG: hypothetical protein HYV07_15180 [Deltaproteobacteria bacterium]|nr:hypothetical protein [Deltaproteobacteria bacterium]
MRISVFLIVAASGPSFALADEALECRGTVACQTFGRCSHDGTRCVAHSDDDCRASKRCREDGLCGRDRRTMSCVLDDDACARTSGCRENGLCGARGERCAPRVSADCEKSAACRREGQCFGSEDGLRCDVHGVSNQDACGRAEVCRTEGRCAASVDEGTRSWVCAPDGPGACQRSEGCRISGACTFQPGGRVASCIAATHEDCRRSVGCGKEQLCFAHDGRCIDRRSHERVTAPSFEALLGPDVRDTTPDELRDEIHFGRKRVVDSPGGPTAPNCTADCERSCLDDPAIRGNEFEEPVCLARLSAHFEERVSGQVVHLTNLPVSLAEYDSLTKSHVATLPLEPGSPVEGRPVIHFSNSSKVSLTLRVEPENLVTFRRDADAFLRAEVVAQINSSFKGPRVLVDPASRRTRRVGGLVELEVLGVRVYDARVGKILASSPRSVLPTGVTPVSFELARLRAPDVAILVLMDPCLDPTFWPRRGCPHLKDRFGGRLYFTGPLCPHGACALSVDEAGSLALPPAVSGSRIHHARVRPGRVEIATDHFPADKRSILAVDASPGEILVFRLEDDTKSFTRLPLFWSRERDALMER